MATPRQRFALALVLAFGLGVLPLALKHGAGSGSQTAIGTGVLGGMIGATLLGIFFVPLFYFAIQKLLRRDHSDDHPAPVLATPLPSDAAESDLMTATDEEKKP